MVSRLLNRCKRYWPSWVTQNLRVERAQFAFALEVSKLTERGWKIVDA